MKIITTFLTEKKYSSIIALCCLMVLLSVTISCSGTSADALETPEVEVPDEEIPEENIPVISIDVYSDQFVIPDDLKVICMNGDEPEFVDTQSCPVIEWLDHTYWALSFTDNRDSLAILAINEEGEVVGRLDVNRVRYLWKIELNEEEEEVTFIGQSKLEATISWTDLRIE